MSYVGKMFGSGSEASYDTQINYMFALLTKL